ncbi:hypothetical protein VU11_06630 [Desulfobulbus sp. US2]|nr:hypothetical protein [Desulfobulbus sp. US4]MCW5208311.1 hypothetical protein [Desulfobulbus sp. US2]MCW5214776.1 hypothetical protein [Desulfobulbus sp. US5]
MSEKIPTMKLGVVKEIVEATGMGISYAYEDLVFLDHNALLLQFTQDSDTVLVHTNREADTEPAQATLAALKQAAREREMIFLDGQVYALTQGEDEQINIEFIP